jgi:hypothetical protein
LWRRRFSIFVSGGIPRLVFAKYGVIFRLRDDWRPDGGVGLSLSLHVVADQKNQPWFSLISLNIKLITLSILYLIA